jgi:hypothetical protein
MKNFIIYAGILGVVGSLEAVALFVIVGLAALTRCSRVIYRTGVQDWTDRWTRAVWVLAQPITQEMYGQFTPQSLRRSLYQ